jgi:hypothetical protein
MHYYIHKAQKRKKKKIQRNQVFSRTIITHTSVVCSGADSGDAHVFLDSRRIYPKRSMLMVNHFSPRRKTITVPYGPVVPENEINTKSKIKKRVPGYWLIKLQDGGIDPCRSEK